MKLAKTSILLSLFASLLIAVSCDRSVVTGPKLTLSNYDRITTGMSKAQVERILGPPTTAETKDMMILKKQPTGTKMARNSPCSHSKMTSSIVKKEIFGANGDGRVRELSGFDARNLDHAETI
jgi:hypothetical protein